MSNRPELLARDFDWFDRVFAEATVTAAITDLNGIFLAVNPAFADALGHPVEELLGHPSVQFYEEAAAARVSRQRAEVLAGKGDSFREQLQMRVSRGRPRTLDSSITLLRDEAGEPLAWMGTGFEITDRLAADETLREERRRARMMEAIFRVSIRSGDLAQWHLFPETGEIVLSEHVHEMLAYEADAMPRDLAALAGLVHPDHAAPVRRAVSHVLAGRWEGLSVDMLVRRADGRYIDVRLTGAEVRTGDAGQPRVIAGSLTDITEDKLDAARLADALGDIEAARAEAEAARATAQAQAGIMHACAESGEIGPWYVCHATNEGWMADYTLRMLGYEPGEVVPVSGFWREAIHPEDVPRAIASMEALIADRSDVYRVDIRIRQRDGSYRWYNNTARKVSRAAQDLPPLICGSLTDIADRKDTEVWLAHTAQQALHARQQAEEAQEKVQQSAEILRASTESGGIAPWTRDEEGLECWYSDYFYQILGYEPGGFDASPAAFAELIHPADRERVARAMADLCEERSEVYRVEYRLRRADGTWGWYRSTATKVYRDALGLPPLICGSVTDISEWKANEARITWAKQAAELAHGRLSRIADNAPGGLFEFEVLDDGTLRFPYTSAKFDDLLGCPAGAIARDGEAVYAQVVEEDRAGLRASVARAVDSSERWSMRFRVAHPAHGLRWLSGSASPLYHPDGGTRWNGTVHDVTEEVEREAEIERARREAEEMRARVEHQALHDVITELPNRRYFDRVMAERQVAGCAAPDTTLIRIDLDHFKYVNDTLGHEAGDAVLAHVARVLQAEIRPGDFAARVGGDEFSILLAPGAGVDEAMALVGRLQRRLAEPYVYQGRQCRFGASFGIASTGTVDRIEGELLSFADAALYRAKELGRNRVEVFTASLHQDILGDRRLATEIQEALERREFLPYFQPQIDAATGTFCGIEVLARWAHPERGILVPGQFLEVADQIRVVPDIDKMMFDETRAALARWRERGLTIPKVSFNVSSSRMHDPDVIAAARAIRHEQTRVTFELLESILVEEESEVFKFHLDQIKETGIEIEIDDFGSGHASIVGLTEIGPTALKIDRRLASPVEKDDRSRKVVGAIVEIGRTLGIRIVAEGVETRAQARLLRDLGCDVLQGYYFARPLSEEDLFAFANGEVRAIA